MKTCSKCKIEKTTDGFYPHKDYRDGLFHLCKECHKASSRPGQKKYYEKNKELVKKRAWERHLRKTYNVTPEEYSLIRESQDNMCAMCKTELVKAYLDHNHSTGRVRGMLCARCNQFLGYIETTPAIIGLAKTYLYIFDD